MIPAFLASTADEIAIPDPGGRLVRYSHALCPPVSLMRMRVHGVECFVERWPGTMVPHPSALAHAWYWVRLRRHAERQEARR